MPNKKRDVRVANRLLATLPKKDYQRLLPELEQVTLTFADIIYEPGQRIRHVYFPNDAIVSLLSEVATSATIEVGMVGNEGLTGIGIFLGVNESRNRAVVQGEGTAMRMKVAALRREESQIASLHNLLRRYTHTLLMQISQSAACNRFHMVNARLARWLLMTSDRLRSDQFRLTQEFMSNMLGVRREGVTVAASALQRSGLISYSRGIINILNRAKLEAISCECYRIVKDESDSYLTKN